MNDDEYEEIEDSNKLDDEGEKNVKNTDKLAVMQATSGLFLRFTFPYF